ncbi:MAG: cysteine synthase family protein [Haliscomenobacter sp.]|nr:cysteine synthase family protein [Haliscomenobacter sp.]MBK8656197.1 cysteine synthase family protein [Haliscomenobacter sp.]MBP9078189.1 cysteine synthase family protein [Haliscomenobacter sp.]MBP9873445.1 cysteine synthase family protein [Haliscomenobacter sp.]
MIYENVLETIGHTPLIKLSRIAADLPCTVLGKVESFNPGQSAKDRIALFMINEAERKGKLKPGGTIVEATSGNTGFSIAIVSALKGYSCILTLTTKASAEKIALLESMGAKVVVCPAEVEPTDPRSYYSQAERIAGETPNSFYLGQNFNLDNAGAHYYTTGPEIWEETQGKVTYYVCCAGTGGTLSGTARYLKEMNPKVNVIAVDAFGSVLTHYFQTGEYDKSKIKPYKVEGLGKNIIPDNLHIQYVDQFVQVTDKDSALRTRELAKKEGLMVGYSSGSALQAVFQFKDQLTPDDVVVVLFPDHGTRYLGKVFNDDWMRQQGFLEAEPEKQPVAVPAPTTPAPQPAQPAKPSAGPSSGEVPGEGSPYPYSYEAMKKRYRTYYRTYRMKYKRYLREAKDSFKLLGPTE